MGDNSQTTNQSQTQNSSFKQLSNMLENMATQGSSNFFNNQNQNAAGTSASNVNPWAPAVPALTNLIGSVSGQGYGLTPGQQAALSAYSTAAGNVPSFGSQGTGAVNNLFGSNNGVPQAGMLGNAYNTYQQTIAPYLNPNYTNPFTNPALSQALATTNEDITNQIRGEFAGANRSDSGQEEKALARGLAQGEGGLLTNEFNTLTGIQQGAINSLVPTGSAAATGQTNLLQTPLMNQIAGLQQAGNIPGLWTAPAQAQLGAANQSYSAPYSNISIPQQLLTQLAGMGGTTTGSTTNTGATAGYGGQSQQQTSSGSSQGTASGTQQGSSTGTSTTTQPVNPITTGLGLGLGLLSLSDERLKENIEPVGLLHNGLNVYRYNIKGDTRSQIGVMAQEVEKVKPEAVREIGGIKMVDYNAATSPGLWRQAA